MKNIVVIFLTISLFSLVTSCEAILLKMSGESSASFKVEGDKVLVNGVLGKKAHKAFLQTLKAHPNLKTLVLQEVPGSINDEWNVKTCAEVRQRRLNTYVESGSVIQSGGVDLYIAGVKRFAEKGARIGVHSWSNGKKDGKDYPPEHEQHDIFVDYFDIINRDTSFYWFTLRAAPADGMHFMTSEELRKYQIVTDWVE